MPQHECTFGYFAQHHINCCDISHLHKLLQIIMSNNMHDTLLSTPSIGSSRRRRRTPSLKLFQVAHQDVRSVVVQRLHDVVPGRELVTSCQLCLFKERLTCYPCRGPPRCPPCDYPPCLWSSAGSCVWWVSSLEEAGGSLLWLWKPCLSAMPQTLFHTSCLMCWTWYTGDPPWLISWYPGKTESWNLVRIENAP